VGLRLGQKPVGERAFSTFRALAHRLLPQASVKRQGLQLILAGEKTQVRFDLAEVDCIRVGRDKGSALVVGDRTVSRKHAELEMKVGRLVLRDLGSANGTFVNDVAVSEQPLFPGDRVRFGSVEFAVTFEAPREDGGPTLAGGPSETTPDELSGARQVWGQSTKVLGGRIADLSVVDLVQVLATCGKTGTLLLFRERFGRIDLREGRVSFAAVDGVRGEKAFFRLLSWREAEFEFHAVVPAADSIRSATDWLLLEGIRLRDEAEELHPKLPDFDAVLALAPNCRVPPPQLSLEELEVLQLVVKVKTLAEILKLSPRPDGEVFSAIVGLLETGLLVDTSQAPLEGPTLQIAAIPNPAERATAPVE
jgi:hypothetical protein